MTITIQEERFEDIVGEVIPLWARHHSEVNEDKEFAELSPDYNAYMQLSFSGSLVVFTAREEGKLVGYSFFFLNHSFHRKQILSAINDLFFLIPEKRGKMVGARLLKEPEQILADKYQVNRIQVRTKTYASFGKLLERAGYEAMEITYRKLIRRP